MWTRLALMIPSLVVSIIKAVETLKGPGNGDTKREAVKEIVTVSVEAVEGITGKDLFNDPEVQTAYRAMNDAIVAFQNLLTKKQQH
jgi:hypothetical protein